jgi:hypothetical protein
MEQNDQNKYLRLSQQVTDIQGSRDEVRRQKKQHMQRSCGRNVWVCLQVT